MARLAHDRFYLVTGTGFATHDFDWIARHIPAGLDADLVDGTSAHAVLSLFGPLAREVLGALTQDDLGNDAFPFGTWRRLRVAGAPVMALRVTYVGELGWELHVPVEFAVTVYEALMAAGAAARHRQCRLPGDRIAAAGEGLPRLGCRHRPRPLAAGGGPGLGGEAEAGHAVPGPRGAARAARPSRCRACSRASPPTPRWCCSAARRSTATGCGSAGSAARGYGYTVGQSIGYGYVRDPAGVDRDYVLAGSYELEVAGERVPAQVFLGPLYDPKALRVRA